MTEFDGKVLEIQRIVTKNVSVSRFNFQRDDSEKYLTKKLRRLCFRETIMVLVIYLNLLFARRLISYTNTDIISFYPTNKIDKIFDQGI